ncbi:MAG: hypothetical protein U5K54_00270 [Cytophagales bacterium]|nr:hypothetical protein [Cytophagales bacterium]
MVKLTGHRSIIRQERKSSSVPITRARADFQFNLYMINEDGSDLEQISYDGVFDSFPMFSPDGKKIIFSSNRNNNGTRDTNLFVADWVD